MKESKMPLRDHFHAPLDNKTSWDGFHGQWPAMIVMYLARRLPRRYVAAPTVRSGVSVEIDVATVDAYEVKVYDTERGRRPVPGCRNRGLAPSG